MGLQAGECPRNRFNMQIEAVEELIEHSLGIDGKKSILMANSRS